AKDIQFEVYPNPASTNLLLKNVGTSTDVMNVDVTNMIGQTVATYRLTNTDLTIPVSNLFNGNYFIRIYNNKTSVVKKFTKI
nr:T9SS type A sorting domain-containing protein [Chitinophagales bacterium]